MILKSQEPQHCIRQQESIPVGCLWLASVATTRCQDHPGTVPSGWYTFQRLYQLYAPPGRDLGPVIPTPQKDLGPGLLKHYIGATSLVGGNKAYAPIAKTYFSLMKVTNASMNIKSEKNSLGRSSSSPAKSLSANFQPTLTHSLSLLCMLRV